jgi:hypothetical protein
VQTTWNNSTTNFNGIVENVTNTMSGTSSSLITLQTGGTNMFSVSPSGGGYFAGTLFTNGAITTGAGIQANAAGQPIVRATATTINTIVTGGFDAAFANGSVIIKGANNPTVTATSAGSAVLQGGYLSGANPVGNFGASEMMAGFLKGTAVANVEDVVCATNVQYAVTDCPVSALTAVGIAVGTVSPIGVVMEGTVPVRLDGALAAIGDLICVSATTAGLGHDNGATICPAGTGIGVAVANSGTVLVGPTGAGTGSNILMQSVTLSTTLPLVALHFR